MGCPVCPFDKLTFATSLLFLCKNSFLATAVVIFEQFPSESCSLIRTIAQFFATVALREIMLGYFFDNMPSFQDARYSTGKTSILSSCEVDEKRNYC